MTAEVAPAEVPEPAPVWGPVVWEADDVAALLRVSPQLVYRMARDGEIPCHTLGRLVRFDRDEITAWWRASGHGPAAAPVELGAVRDDPLARLGLPRRRAPRR